MINIITRCCHTIASVREVLITSTLQLLLVLFTSTVPRRKGVHKYTMGGDHKCPVCQATFTRPQHVARHMRSHTGDRPYKCQHCGDQFARSDLLSRHINKCHANEKAPPNTAGGKRKGSAAASRATTSKQACDQCVQLSLPCDGSNPCSKCVSRKCRCTYVKFHRQTAPIGPGHQPPRSVAPSASSPVIGSTHPHLDDLILGPPPPSVPSMATSSDSLLSTQFSFNPAYPPASTVDLSSIPVSVASLDVMTDKFRSHTDLLRRGGGSSSSPSTSVHPASTTGANVFSGIYASQSQPGWYSWGDPASGSASLFDASRFLPPLDDKDFPTGVTRAQIPSAVSEVFDPDFYNPNGLGSGYRARRASLDFSDSSSAPSQSVPSSATSSSVHLPLPGPGELFDNTSEDVECQRREMLVDSQRRDVPCSQPSSYPTSEQPRPTSEGGFSSAFGLMSIEDQNALAQLQSDGVPFFSNVGVGGVVPHSPNATPMPARQASHPQQPGHQPFRDRGMSLSALHTPGEMREFWKAYVRTPLSGPAGDDAAPNTNTSQSQQTQMPMSPSSQRRRLRVSSLPSVTPTVERGHPLMNGYGGGHGEGSRGSLHGNSDDLRSYEAAVNARSAFMNLNLVPRRRGTRPGASASPVPPSVSAENQSTTDMTALSRPSSSSSVSSLAHAFGPHQSFVKPPPLSNASISLPVPSVHGHGLDSGSFGNSPRELPSRESSVASDGTGSSEGEVFRPSFKRLASQTLGPANSKRALVERGAGGSGETIAVAVADGGRLGAGGNASKEPLGTGNASLRPMAALPDRARRTSEAGLA